MAADLNTTIVGMQTAITMYTLVMAAFMLIGGKIGDRWGAKRAFWIGLIVYGIGSMITALSQNLTQLLIGWSLIEGLGAVLVIPAIAALTAKTYTGKQRALCYGILGGVAGASMAAGPLIGGWVTAYYSWRYVFFGETVIVLFVMLFLKLIPATVGRKTKLDTVGAVLSAAGLGAIVLGVLQSSQWGWIDAQGGGALHARWAVAHALADHLRRPPADALRRREERVKARGEEPLLDMALLGIPQDAGRPRRPVLPGVHHPGHVLRAAALPADRLGFDALETGKTILPLSIALFVFALGGCGHDAASRRSSSCSAVWQRCWSARSCCCTSSRPTCDGRLRGRHGADRRRARPHGVPGGQRHHVVGRPLARR